ncbi:MAG: type VI secretion system baseplate subunit TssF [Candidatus Delongbacteria bacterium]|nr:type VI secretion system baseplate subunit TssF [Candidatus Delongbacteria bacterium]
MKTKDYYLRELNTLRTEGVEFAKMNPGLSSFLSQEGQDPDVERLLEGFAFLTGKLRQKFDEELPEVSNSLVQLLWPNYVRPIPSYAIIKFNAPKNSTETAVVLRDTQVLAEKSLDGVICKFKTCYETKVMPLEIEDVEYLVSGQKSSIELQLKMTSKGSLSDINFEPLRIFLGGSKFMSRELFLFLNRYIEKIELIIEDEENNTKALELPKDSIKSVGFNAAETILPYPSNIFDAYIVLHEYFCYQEKYLFVDLFNLQNIKNISDSFVSNANKFTIKISFSKYFNATQSPGRDDFFLYCTPVVNLFESDSIPIRKSSHEDEYMLMPSELSKSQCEVFSILNVRGWVQSKNRYQDYFPFESFVNVDENYEYYSSKVKLNDTQNRTETYLRFSASQKTAQNIEHNNAVVSVRMLCTHRDLPSKLHLGAICSVDANSNCSVEFKNLTIPSISYPPPIGGDFLWKIISNMSLNYLSIKDIKTLKVILKTYDFLGENDLRQKKKTTSILEGLTSITTKRTEMIYEGMAIRGLETEITLDPSKFIGVGEAYLFSSVLNEFLSLYSSINSFHRFIVNIENYEIFSWTPKIGFKDMF